MARTFLTPIDMNKNEIQNVVIQNLASAPGTPVEGQLYYNTTDDTLYFRDASSWVSTAPDGTGGGNLTVAGDTGSQSVVIGTDTLTISGLTGITTAAIATDTITIDLDDTAVTPGSYGSATQVMTGTVDQQGRLTAAGQTAIAIPSSAITDLSSNAVTSLSGTTNEIEVSGSTGAVTVGLPDDVTIGQHLTVTGNLTVNGTTTTVNSTVVQVDDPIFTIGENASDDNKDRGLAFLWHTGAAAKEGFFGYDDSTGYFTFIPDATNTSEVFSGTQGDIDVNEYRIGGTSVLSATTLGSGVTASSLTSVGTITSGTWTGTAIAVANGGTGATDAGTARTNLGLAIGTNVQAYDAGLADIAGLAVTDGNIIVGDGANWVAESGATARASLGATTKVSQTIGDGASTTLTVTHNLGTDDVIVEVYDATSKETIVCDVDRSSTNAVALTFATAPASNSYRAVIIG